MGDYVYTTVEEQIKKLKKQQLSIIDINGSSFYKAVHNKLMRPLK